MWPRACPEGSLTPWLSLSVQGVGAASSAMRNAVCLLHRPRSIAIQIFRTIRSRSSGKCWPQIGCVLARLPGQFCPGNRGVKQAAFRGRLVASRGLITLESRRRVGHHGGDAASVLGTVQGAALRSACAYARPSGLDGACAQMIRGQLRDGRRMFLGPEHTTNRWIHWTASRRARVCSIPSGRVRLARLLRFIFHDLTVDGRRERRYSVRIRWCCTHLLRESVTEAEQLMMLASRASINSYLRRAGK
jgi:hypothetical protein